MSRLLENIIRKFLFEQVVKGTIYPLEQNEKTESEDAGAVQGFKVVVDQEISDEEWEQYNPGIEKSDVNLGRHYQKNIVQVVNNFFNEKTVAGYNDVLDENHIVIMGNTPTGTESFSLMFWIFTLDKFFEFSTKKEDEKVTFQDKDVRDVSLGISDDVIQPTRFSILQSKCLTYTEYLNRYNTTNTELAEINQGVQQDVITLATTEKNREQVEFIESLEFPKEISTFTCFAIIQNDDTIQQVINIDSNTQEENYIYITYQYDEWIKWSKNIQGISKEKATSENSYQVRQACNIEKTSWSSVKVLNDLIKRQYSETDYNDLLFDDAKWQTTFITKPNAKVEEINQKYIDFYDKSFRDQLDSWTDKDQVSRFIWPGAISLGFKSYDEYLKQLYNNLPDNLKYLILKDGNKYSWNDFTGYSGYDPDAKTPQLPTKTITRTGNYMAPDSKYDSYGPDQYKWAKLAPITTDEPYFSKPNEKASYKTKAGKVIREAGIEYLNGYLEVIPWVDFSSFKCNQDTGEIYYKSKDEMQKILDIVKSRLYLTTLKSQEDYFDFIIDKLQQVNLGAGPPDIDPEYEIEPVTPPNIE